MVAESASGWLRIVLANERTLACCRIREFYLGKLVHITEGDADVVLPTNEEQRSRLVTKGQNCAELFRSKPAYGLVRSDAFKQSYEPLGWTKLDQAGDFVLIGNAGLIARDRIEALSR